MRLIPMASQLPRRLPRPVVAIGTFDGVHRSHQAIVRHVLREAHRQHGTSVIISFDPHPQHVLRPGYLPPLLTRVDQRLELFRTLGVQVVWLVRFTRRFAQLSPEDFFSRLLIQRLRAHTVVVGSSFGFGRGRMGNLDTLRALGHRARIAVHRVPDVLSGGAPINSSRIRAAIAAGRLGEAQRLLGRPVQLRGRVVHGAARGARLGFPTANLDTGHLVLPPPGVYVVRAQTGNRWRAGVANVGYRPTFHDTRTPVVETHLLRFYGRLYGRTITVEWLRKLRDERSFPNLASLRRQIQSDVDEATRFFRRQTHRRSHASTGRHAAQRP